MRKIISGLFHGSKPAVVMAVLVAVVGVTGTAYAGKSNNSGSKGDSKQGQTWKKSDKGEQVGTRARATRIPRLPTGVSGAMPRVGASRTASPR